MTHESNRQALDFGTAANRDGESILDGFTKVEANFAYAFGILDDRLLDEVASGTNPNIVPNESDLDTGIGSNAANTLSLIAGGVGVIHCLSTGTGKVGIGTTTVPHGGVGYANLALDGAASSANGPHIQCTVDTDDYPTLQVLNYAHDNVDISFDAYFPGGAWYSSDPGSNFQISKNLDKLSIKYDSGVAAGSVLTWNNGIVLEVDGSVILGNNASGDVTVESANLIADNKIGIGTDTVPHAGVGTAILAIEGADSSGATGPHIQTTTATDNYPLMQIVSWTHDNIAICFDSYLSNTGAVWYSSDAGSNFQIYKNADMLKIQYDSGVSQGVGVTWNPGVVLHPNGHLGLGTVSIPSGGGDPALILADAVSDPTGMPANHGGIYAKAGEVYCIDSGDNATLQTPHPQDAPADFYEEPNGYENILKTIRYRHGEVIWVHQERPIGSIKPVKLIETFADYNARTGENLVQVDEQTLVTQWTSEWQEQLVKWRKDLEDWYFNSRLYGATDAPLPPASPVAS